MEVIVYIVWNAADTQVWKNRDNNASAEKWRLEDYQILWLVTAKKK
jgi:hypothetical protein